MTNGNFEHRLDQVEEIAAILVTHVEAIDSRLEQVTAKLDRLADNQEQVDRRVDGLVTRIDGLTSNVDALAALMAQQIRESELDRQQAAEDRAQVRSLVEALTQRFNGNGHS